VVAAGRIECHGSNIEFFFDNAKDDFSSINAQDEAPGGWFLSAGAFVIEGRATPPNLGRPQGKNDAKL